MSKLVAFVFFLGVVGLSAGVNVPSFTPLIAVPEGYTALKRCNDSVFYTTIVKNSTYDHPIFVLDLHGSRYQTGYDYGYMLAEEVVEMYKQFMSSLIGDKWYEILIEGAFEEAMVWQWNDFLSKELPEEYKEELRGIEDGGIAAGQPKVGQIIKSVITLANAPGDLKDFVYIIMREFKGNAFANKIGDLPSGHRVPRGQCSMFAVWGNRTVGQKLFSGRNLDWESNLGINRFKLMTVFHPEGKTAHATLGYIGLWGAIAGMSAKGLTVHEANLEENEITFGGFAWLLRLRYIMENAATSAQAHTLWEQTNNTVGFNHMVASAPDALAYANNQPTIGVAYAMETMFNYTAYFTDDDPREANALYKDQHIGFPIKEAVWRTNHGYDPEIRKHYEWSQAPSSWSMQRYMFIHDGIVNYEQQGVKMGLNEATALIAVAGDKGKNPYTCADASKGSNVISVGFAPSDLVMNIAWESKNGTAWLPACCSTYVTVDMKHWFN